MNPDWDDLKLVLAIADNGGLTGAAKKLGVHYATVLRRLDSFEYRTGSILFDRKKTGYEATDAGEALAAEVREIANQVDQTYLRLAGADLRLSGSLRIASSDFVSQYLLPEVLTRFSSKHPGVQLELTISPQFASLTKRDADIAIRMSNEVEKGLTGQPISELSFAIYGRSDVTGQREKLSSAPWIADAETLTGSMVNQWQVLCDKKPRIALRVNSTMTRYCAIRHGMGIGFLPTILGDADSDLVCLKRDDTWRLSIWFLSHIDLANMNRLQAFKDIAQNSFQHLQLK